MTVQCSLASLSVLAEAKLELSLVSLSLFAEARIEMSLVSISAFALRPTIQWSLGSFSVLTFSEPVGTTVTIRAAQIIG